MRIGALVTLILTASVFSHAEVAVFQPHGVNTDQSFVEAFGMLLANKYRSVANVEIISPPKAARALDQDSSLVKAAQALGVKEYLETEAIGLYLSRTEKAKVEYDGIDGKQTVIVKVDTEGDDDDPVEDQQLLDNHKCIVTVTRRDASGNKIHMVEMTLLTYGDIEESTDRIARALFNKVSIDEVRTAENITRREGMGDNKLFIESFKGVKVGIFYPAATDVTIEDIVTFGYNHRLEAEKFFMEFGVSAKFPTTGFDTYKKRAYGGVQFEMGGSYFILPGIVGLYGGLGISPFLSFGEGNEIFQIGLMPFIQVGATFPRTAPVRGFVNFKVGQNVLEIETGDDHDPYDYYYSDDDDYLPKKGSYPTEFGVEFGVGF